MLVNINPLKTRVNRYNLHFVIVTIFFYISFITSTVYAEQQQSTAGSETVISENLAIESRILDDGYTTPITFSEFPEKTTITNQYQDRGIIFGPEVAFIQHDTASNRSPVLSGTPLFAGPISGSFVDPSDTTRKIGASDIKMRVGFMNNTRSVKLFLYDKKGTLIQTKTTTIKNGFELFNIKAKDKLFYSWRIQTIANEIAGYAIDDFSVKLAKPIDVVASVILTSDHADSVGSTNEPITGKNITAKIELKDSKGAIVTYPFIKCKWQNIPDLNTKTLTEKDGDEKNSCQLTYQYAKEDGPSYLSYGKKIINFTGKIDVGNGEEQEVTTSYKYKVFFDKDNVDKGSNPNWFEYWSKNNAVPGLSDSYVIFSNSINSYGDSNYDPNGGLKNKHGKTSSKIIRLSNLAAEEHYPGGLSIPNKTECPGGIFGGVKGIHSVAEVISHENKHLELWDNWLSPSSPKWSIVKNPDSDDPTPNDKHDIKGDNLPDSYETSVIKTDPNNLDSCDLAQIKHPSYANYGDDEYNAIAHSNGAKGIEVNDWANPGSQTNPSFKYNQQADNIINVKKTDDYLTQIMTENDKVFLSLMSNMNFEGYEITDTFSDALIDENADGIPDYLVIRAKVNFPYPDEYDLTAYLADNSGSAFIKTRTHGKAIVGENTIELRFDAKLLKSYGSNGVFHLKGLDLYIVDVATLATKINAYTTNSYNLSDVPLQTLLFTEKNFSDKGIDQNGNGLFEKIELNIEVQINKTDNYTIKAGAGFASGETVVNLVPGKHSVAVLLNLDTVVALRDRNPLYLDQVSAYNSKGNLITSIALPAYQLQTQGFNRFEKPIVFINETSFKDYPVNLNGQQRADFIGLDVDMSVTKAGDYLVSFDVLDKENNLITEEEHYLQLKNGKQTIYLSIATDPFVKKRVDGPYTIRFFTVRDKKNIDIDSLQNIAYQTKSYKYTDFEDFNPVTIKPFASTTLNTTGAILHEGDVYVWGYRGSAQQGNGIKAVVNESAPEKVKSLKNIMALTGGTYHLLALDQKGDVYGWGQSLYGETGCQGKYVSTPCKVLENISQIAAGEYFSIALDTNGQVWTWGQNTYGQLGNENSKNSNQPKVVNLNGEKARLIGGAYESAFAVTENNHVWAWGDNEASGLGFQGSNYGVQKIIHTPTRIPNLDKYASKIVYIAGGNGWGEALLDDGTVIGWGLHAALGQGTSKTNISSPKPVKILTDVKQLFARYVGSVALTKDGKIYTWGQTGGNAFPMLYGSEVTERIPHNRTVVAVGGGKKHIFYQTEDGKIYGIGYNDLYKLKQTTCCGPNIDWPGNEINIP